MTVSALLRGLGQAAYRRFAAGPGLRALERALHSGLPAELAPALRFLFTGAPPPPAREAASRVERLRDAIAGRPDRFQYVYRDSPLGPIRWPEVLPHGEHAEETISARELALRISVPRRWGLFLHLVSEGFGARTVLETGACVGVSGAYLASASAHPRFVTVEGSRALAEITRTTLASVTEHATVVSAPFETGIGQALELLAGEERAIDLAYIDGHHDREATLHYVGQVRPHLGTRAVVVLDDIHLYSEMWSAWQTILATSGFAEAVNVGRFGILVWNGSPSETTAHYDLARYTGWWRVGRTRQRSLRHKGE